MKKYKAIFFDWDGTAVTSRKAPVDKVIEPMKKLLNSGVKLAIISGTTIENIAGGNLQQYFNSEELKNLYLGLGRGAFNYRFDEEKKPFIFSDTIPNREKSIKIHEICFEIHKELYEKYEFHTDIVFSRPNYCKIDLMVDNNRGENLFFQDNELEILKNNLKSHGFEGGLIGLIKLAEEIGERFGISVSATTDAKYLEVGVSSKSNNVNTILKGFNEEYNILSSECCYWGDEYLELDKDIFGSDSFMITEMTKDGDFFDVSIANGRRPDNVKILGGGVSTFLQFLEDQSK